MRIVRDGLSGLRGGLQGAVAKGLDAAKGPLLADMQRRTPVDTGALRGSETATVSGTTLTLRAGGASAPYAGYVHQGTRYMTGRPFMRDAVEAGAPQIQQALTSALGDLT